MLRRLILQINSPNRIFSILSLSLSLLGAVGLVTFVLNEVQTGNLTLKSLTVITGQALGLGIAVAAFILGKSIFQGIEDVFYREEQIICGTGVSDTRYSWQRILDTKCNKIILAGQSIRTRFAQPEFRERIVTLLKSNNTLHIIIIMTVPEIMKATHGDRVGYLGFIDTVTDLRDIYYHRLDKPERERLSVHFHPGTSSLSATIRDPDNTDRGIIVFTPKWATDRESQNRMYCVLEKWRHRALFNKLYGHIYDMTRRESGSLQEMCKKLKIELPSEDTG